MPFTGATIAAMSAGNMAFCSYAVTHGIAADTVTEFNNFTDKFMADDAGCLNIARCAVA